MQNVDIMFQHFWL